MKTCYITPPDYLFYSIFLPFFSHFFSKNSWLSSNLVYIVFFHYGGISQAYRNNNVLQLVVG